MIAHGYNHIYRGGKIKGTAGWFSSLGMNPGIFHAWLASITELAAGLGLVVGSAHAARHGRDHRHPHGRVHHQPPQGGFLRVPAAHRGLGVPDEPRRRLYAIACLGAGRWSLDDTLGFHLNGWWGFVVAVVVGFGGAAATLIVFWRPPAPSPSS